MRVIIASLVSLSFMAITIFYAIKSSKTTSKYRIEVITHYKDGVNTGHMYHDLIKIKDGSYFLKYDSAQSDNYGIDSAEINIVKQ